LPLSVVPLPNGQFAENCYLVFHPDAPETILIDPGEEAERFLAAAAEARRRISGIWLTHAHLDHVLGVGRIQEATAAPIYLHPADRALYDEVPEQGALFGLRAEPQPAPQLELRHGQRLELGDVSVEVRHVPGHSPGHVCFVAPGMVFCGDVVFAGSIGRTDLPGGDFATLIAGIQRELLTLPDDTVLYPGHGPATTVGQERATNPFLRPSVAGRYRPA
jgi:glyoxylase-like metal-dependent hydrolase (beta-lactamase superfamily II)